MTPGDRILMVAANLRQAGRDLGRPVSEVEKLGLYYVAVSPQLGSARQIREFVLRCLEHVPVGEDRIKYDHLFSAGDSQSKEFWVKARSNAPALINSYVHIVEQFADSSMRSSLGGRARSRLERGAVPRYDALREAEHPRAVPV